MKLKDICIGITDGSHNPPQGGEISDYYMISSKNIFDDRITMDEPRYLSEEQFLSENKRTNIVPGDVLMTIVGTVGRAAVVNKDIGKITLQRSVAVLHPKKDICDSRYLMYALQSKKAYFEKEAHGVAQKGLYLKQLSDIDIVVPAIDKQVITVDLLDRVNGIIKYRQKQIEALDNLIKARFVEMFGDPFTNSKKWRRMTFREAGDRLSDGPFGSNLKSEHYTDVGVRVIRLGNIGVRNFIDDDKSYISKEHYETLKKYTCKAGEIVIGTLGEPNLRACLVPENIGFAINKADCVHYIPKSDILNNDFVCQYINCPETLLLAEGMIHGQTRARISSGQLAQMPIFIPPLELQNQFADFVKQVDKSKVAVQRALEETQILFDSLMQEYFG